MFVRRISLLTIVVAALLPALARGQDADTALTRIQQNKAVTIGFRESAAPFSYLNESTRASGYCIDVCTRIAQEIGRKLNIPRIEIRYVSRARKQTSWWRRPRPRSRRSLAQRVRSLLTDAEESGLSVTTAGLRVA